MATAVPTSRNRLFTRVISIFICFTFISTSVIPPQYVAAQTIAQPVFNLPAPGAMVTPTPGFTPPTIKGLQLDPQNPLKFHFYIDAGENQIQGQDLRDESTRLIKYFLAALTTPDKELWVNLSPYEKNRIISDSLGQTEMGRDMLAQDYILKQLTASLMYPENETGKDFWQRVHQKSYALYGTTDIPVNTFNKIWIVPQSASIYEHQGRAFVVESKLKVMLEEDYLAAANYQSAAINEPTATKEDLKLTTEIIKNVLIPEITKEVNEGATFANLRQVYNALILSAWYKTNLKETLLGQVYVDQAKTKGVNVSDPQISQKIYQQYLEAFKVGVYNYIREEFDAATKTVVPRKYFSGGEDFAQLAEITNVYTESDLAMLPAATRNTIIAGATQSQQLHEVTANLYEATDANVEVIDAAMTGRKYLASDEIDKLKALLLRKAGSAAQLRSAVRRLGSTTVGTGIQAIFALQEIQSLYSDDPKMQRIIDQSLTKLTQIPGIEIDLARADITIETADAGMTGEQAKLIRAQLRTIAAQMVPANGGILAADESTGSAGKRLAMVGLENTPDNRQIMRRMMLTTEGIENLGINAVILYDETFDNVDAEGKNLVAHHLTPRGIIAGLKTDRGLAEDPESPGEMLPKPEGLQQLAGLLKTYSAKGAQFTKWRVTVTIDPKNGLPTEENIRKNMVVLAKSAKQTQLAGLVPIVEPEVLLDGDHDIQTSYDATTRTLEILFEELAKEDVWLDGVILKTSMILSGNKADNRADSKEVGYQTLKGLLKTVPAEVPAIVFLSGGQGDDEVNQNLDAVIRANQTRFIEARDEAVAELLAEGKKADQITNLETAPWEISYSFGRGLQRRALLAWGGTPEGYAAGQAEFQKTASEVQAARLGALTDAAITTGDVSQLKVAPVIKLGQPVDFETLYVGDAGSGKVWNPQAQELIALLAENFNHRIQGARDRRVIRLGQLSRGEVTLGEVDLDEVKTNAYGEQLTMREILEGDWEVPEAPEALVKAGAILTGPWTPMMGISAVSGRVITPEDREAYDAVLNDLQANLPDNVKEMLAKTTLQKPDGTIATQDEKEEYFLQKLAEIQTKLKDIEKAVPVRVFADLQDAVVSHGDGKFEGPQTIANVINENQPDITRKRDGKVYSVPPREEWPAITIRIADFDMPNRHVSYKGKSVYEVITSLVMALQPNFQALLDDPRQTIGLVIPKLENADEVKLVIEMIRALERELGIAEGQIHLIFMNETLRSAVNLKEMMWTGRKHIKVSNVGRWDKGAGDMREHYFATGRVFGDLSRVGMDMIHMDHYVRQNLASSVRHNVLPEGGMVTAMPSPNYEHPETDMKAIRSIVVDKLYEWLLGYGYAWVASPSYLPLVQTIFQLKRDWTPVIEETPYEESTALLKTFPEVELTRAGLKQEIFELFTYLFGTRNTGMAVAVDGYNQEANPGSRSMFDGATGKKVNYKLWMAIQEAVQTLDEITVTDNLLRELLEEVKADWGDRYRQFVSEEELEIAEILFNAIITSPNMILYEKELMDYVIDERDPEKVQEMVNQWILRYNAWFAPLFKGTAQPADAALTGDDSLSTPTGEYAGQGYIAEKIVGESGQASTTRSEAQSGVTIQESASNAGPMLVDDEMAPAAPDGSDAAITAEELRALLRRLASHDEEEAMRIIRELADIEDRAEAEKAFSVVAPAYSDPTINRGTRLGETIWRTRQILVAKFPGIESVLDAADAAMFTAQDRAEIEEIREWMNSERFKNVSGRTWTAEDIWAKRGLIDQSVPGTSNILARKLYWLIRTNQDAINAANQEGREVTFADFTAVGGVMNGVYLAMAAEGGLPAAYFSGWQASNNLGQTDEAKYNFKTVPDHIRAITAYSLNKNEHRDESFKRLLRELDRKISNILRDIQQGRLDKIAAAKELTAITMEGNKGDHLGYFREEFRSAEIFEDIYGGFIEGLSTLHESGELDQEVINAAKEVLATNLKELLTDYLIPLFADGDTGHQSVRELAKEFVLAGAGGIHLEDQAHGQKKCGHLGGKVLDSIMASFKRLREARQTADLMGSELVVISRTDAEAARLLANANDGRDHRFILGTSSDKVSLAYVIRLALGEVDEFDTRGSDEETINQLLSEIPGLNAEAIKELLSSKTAGELVTELEKKSPKLARTIRNVWSIRGKIDGRRIQLNTQIKDKEGVALSIGDIWDNREIIAAGAGHALDDVFSLVEDPNTQMTTQEILDLVRNQNLEEELKAMEVLTNTWADYADAKTYADAVADYIKSTSDPKIASNRDAILALWLEALDPLKNTLSHSQEVALAKELGVEIDWTWEPARTYEGYYQIDQKLGVENAIRRQRVFMTVADVAWMEEGHPNHIVSGQFADGVLANPATNNVTFASNLSPSFNWSLPKNWSHVLSDTEIAEIEAAMGNNPNFDWKDSKTWGYVSDDGWIDTSAAVQHMNDEIEQFSIKLAQTGKAAFQFVTIWEHHVNMLAAWQAAKRLKARGAAGFVDTQRVEQKEGAPFTKHQRYSGLEYVQGVREITDRGSSAAGAKGKGLTEVQQDGETEEGHRTIKADQALTSIEEEPVGGIDLNPALLDLQIKRDGNGIPLPLAEQPSLLEMQIEGFLPVIINIQPVTNLPLLLGWVDTNGNTTVGFDFNQSPFDRRNAYIDEESQELSLLN